MSIKQHTARILDLIDEIVSRTKSIDRHPHREAALEIDLVMEDLRLLYRHFEMMKKVGEPAPRPGGDGSVRPEAEGVPSFFNEPDSASGLAHKPVTEPESRQEPLSGPSATPQTHSQPAPEAQVTPKPMPIPEPRPAPQPEHKPQPEPTLRTASPSPSGPPSASGPKPSPAPGSFTVSQGNNGKAIIDLLSDKQASAIGDKLAGHDNSLHQRISSQKEDRSIGSRLQRHPISNIKDAIGLNEKFLFINELFNGDIQAYNDAIEKLNGIGSLQQAFDHLNSLTRQYGWEAGRSSETIEKLAEFVQRRYMNV